MSACKACENREGNILHTAREMMLGMRTEFQYQECSRCGSLQIQEVPGDLGDYYPSSYYSFQKPSGAKAFLKRHWAAYSYRKRGVVGRALALGLGENQSVAALREVKLEPETAILDVGCGSGDLLFDLSYLGFRHLRGADPYNREEIRHEGVVIWNCSLGEVKEQFDLIMFHHSLEHMAEPRQVFMEIERALKPGGTVLIRVPVAATYAWRKYRTNWVQLDAPRHLFIPSARGLGWLAEAVGFEVAKTVYDSTDFQFWGSEQYQQDISLADKRSHHKNPLKVLFPDERIRTFRKNAEELNQAKDGDSACFYLRRK